MMDSHLFTFDKLISENNLSQAWIGTHIKTKKTCFLKIPSPRSDIDRETVHSILAKSFECQQLLRSHRILHATACHLERNNLIIEYPYVDFNEWRVLTSEIFWKHYPTVLNEICLTADYLHSMRLVHCDFKVNNFLIRTKRKSIYLILVDLDFLTISHSSPGGRVFGTPGYIAPEIMQNERIVPESDNYSLGRSLKQCVDYLRPAVEKKEYSKTVSANSLRTLTERLTSEDPTQRPRYLTDALLQEGIVNNKQHERALKSLFALHLVTSFKREGMHKRLRSRRLRNFIAGKHGIFGIPNGLLDDLEPAYRKNRLATFRICKTLVQRARLNRYGDYWQLSITDDALEEGYRSIDSIIQDKINIPPSGKINSVDDLRNLLETSRRVKQNKGFLRSFLLIRGALDQISIPETDELLSIQKEMFKELGGLAKALNRTSSAIRFLSTALHMTDKLSEVDITLTYDLTYQFLIAGQVDEAERLAKRGLEESALLGDHKYQIAFQRQEAWIRGSRGGIKQSIDALNILLEKAADYEYLDEMQKIYTTLGVLFWRKGEYLDAKECFKKSINSGRKQGSLSETVSLFTNMSLLCYELAEYKRAIIRGKRAIKSASQPSDNYKLPATYASIVLSLIRLEEFNEAEEWLEQYLIGKSQTHDKAFFRNYYFLKGNLSHNRGNLQLARVSFLKGLRMYELYVVRQFGHFDTSS